MEQIDYRAMIRNLRISRKLGQNFLMNHAVARTEANFGADKVVLEMGPGLGILTRELCKTAKKVIAVERDEVLFGILEGSLRQKNLELIKSDFFKVPVGRLAADIMISNIPYNLSSRVVMWLGEQQMPGFVCIQREFAEHMVSKPGERNYSKLSVMCSLLFTVTYVMDVSRNDFYPVPKVDSALVFLKPREVSIDKKTSGIISALMMHKKKKLRNALIDSAKVIGLDKDEAMAISEQLPSKDKRGFQATPEEILETAKQVKKKIIP